ncbi:uncharacterized protein LOC144468598 [Augochlora pura]
MNNKLTQVSAHLRAYNMASYPGCSCGILKDQEKEFTAWFEFKCSSGRVRITPPRGTLKSKQFVKVFFVFEPGLPGSRPKIDESKKPERSKKRDRSKEPQKTKKEKKKTAESEEMSDADKLAEEASLLETFEPKVLTIFATCFIDLTTKDGQKREELLFVKMVCPVTRPEIVILDKYPDIKFGPTAIGTSSRKILRIKNISTK